MKKRTTILTALTLTGLLFTGCAAQQAQVDRIDLEAAKAAAVEAAGFSSSEVSFLSAELDKRNGIEYYDIDFTAGGKEYDYDIDALTGTVIGSELPESAKVSEGNIPVKTADDLSVEELTLEPKKSNTTVSDELISEESAKEIALEHAGVSADNVKFVKSGLDRDDGRRVYDVEFYSTDFVEYDYDIDALTGEILSFDHDAEYYAPAATAKSDTATAANNNPATSSSKEITEAEAKKIALAQVPGASENDIYGFEVDYDDGRLEYEGTIYFDHMEYEFEIDGYSGAIRNWDVESIYD